MLVCFCLSSFPFFAVNNTHAYPGGSICSVLRRVQYPAADLCGRAGVLAWDGPGTWGNHPPRLEGEWVNLFLGLPSSFLPAEYQGCG